MKYNLRQASIICFITFLFSTEALYASGTDNLLYIVVYNSNCKDELLQDISFPAIVPVRYGAADFDPGATSSMVITYTSGNLAVATIVSNEIHVVGAGTAIITASSGGNSLTQTLTVLPAPLYFSANDETRNFGQPNPTLTFTYSGFVNGDSLSSLTTQPNLKTADSSSPAGSYTIIISGAVDPNYTFNYQNGVLTVDSVPLVFNPIPVKTYGDADFDPGATSGSNITYNSSNTNVAYFISNKVHIVMAGTTVITATDSGVSLTQTLTVQPASLTITANNQTVNYFNPIPPLTFVYSGFVNNDNSSSLSYLPTASTTATSTSNVGSYPIILAGAEDPDYNIKYDPGTLQINPIQVPIPPPVIQSSTGSGGGGGVVGGSSAPLMTVCECGCGCHVTYTSSNSSVVAIVASYVSNSNGGTDTLYSCSYVGTGTANIYASQSGGGNFIASSDSTSVTVTLPDTASKQLLPDSLNAIGLNNQQVSTTEPIQLGTGSYEYTHTDLRVYAVKGTLNFTRFYNSLKNSVNGSLGYGWSHSYNYRLSIKKDSVSKQDSQWDILYADGHRSTFIPLNDSTGKSYPLYIGTQEQLKKNTGGDFTLLTKDNLQFHFTSAGVLDHISDLNGNTTTLIYTGNNLTSIVGQGGRTLKLAYDGSNIISVTDPLNRSCIFVYDGSGNLQTVKNAKGNLTTFTYDAGHRMLSATNPLGNIVVNNAYDTRGRVISQKDANNQTTTIVYDMPSAGYTTVTNPDNSQYVVDHDKGYRKTYIQDELGFTRAYAYDVYGNENSFTDENSNTETRQFDRLGNLLVRNQPGGITTQISYNTFNSPLQITDPNGNVNAFTYDINNNLVSRQLPDNTTQNFTVFSTGLCNTFKDGNGNTVAYTYSANGDLLTAKAFNGTKAYAYDAAGRCTAITDENGNTAVTAYDNNDNIISVTDALKHAIHFTYDASNQLISVTDKNGNITSFTYDKKGRLVTKTNANGGVIKNMYDVRDNLISFTDPDNNTITYTYDTKGRKMATTNTLGTTQLKYDAVGNVISIIDGTNKTIGYTYSPTYKVITVSDALSNTNRYTYDKNNNLITTTDPLSKTTKYSYDAMNRQTAALDANSNTTKITYDADGNKKTVADANGHTQTYTYDSANRITGYLDAAGNTTSYKYDAAGNPTLITEPTGTIVKTYDAINRLVSATNSTGDKYAYTYDNDDNVLTTSSSGGKSYLSYDNLGELVQYTDPFNNKVLYGYDAAGNKRSITYPGNKIVNYTFDNANNLKKVSDWMSHTFTYTYDAAGRVTQLLYPNGIHCDYTFDAAGRLTGRNNGYTSNSILAGSAFTLDAVGNRMTEQKLGTVPSNLMPASRAYNYGNDDRLLKDSVWTYINDNAGNRISETKGQIKETFTFSVDDRLINMVDTTGTALSFAYDAMGDRLSRSAGNVVNRYVLDISRGLSQVLQITDGAGVIRSQYIYGPNLLERVDSTGNVLYYLYDGQHNTVALTDTHALVTDTYTYDPFGTLLVQKGNTRQPFTFLGEFGVEQESATLFYARARYYDAANGRFLSKDAYPNDISNPQTLNRYVYSFNNAVNRYDPSGLFGWASLEAAAGQLILATSYTAQTALNFAALPEASILEGTSSVLSGIQSANNAAKNLNAGLQNVVNAFNSDDNFVTSEDYHSPLDNPIITTAESFAPALTAANAAANLPSAFSNIVGALTNITTAISNIKAASNYLESLPTLAGEALDSSFNQLTSGVSQLFNGVKGLNSDFNDILKYLNGTPCNQ